MQSQTPARLLPVQATTPEPAKPLKRHHTVRYYAHRVRESLVTRVSKTLCVIFLSLLLIVGIVFFILWLNLRPHRPRFHIHQFSVPGLDTTQITFNVTARNSNQKIGIFYESMEGLVYYKDQRVGSTSLGDSFYQEPKTTTILIGTLGGATLSTNSQRGQEFVYDRSQGKVAFRLEIKSTIRFKVKTWDTKRHTLHANCEIMVGADGLMLPIYKDKRCPVYFT